MPSPLVSAIQRVGAVALLVGVRHAVAVGVVVAVDDAVAVGVRPAGSCERIWNSVAFDRPDGVRRSCASAASVGLSPDLALEVVRDAVAVGVGRRASRTSRPAPNCAAAGARSSTSCARRARAGAVGAGARPSEPPDAEAERRRSRRRWRAPAGAGAAAAGQADRSQDRRAAAAPVGPVRGVLLVAASAARSAWRGARRRWPPAASARRANPSSPRAARRARPDRGCRRRGRQRSCPRNGGRRGRWAAQRAPSWRKCCQCPTCLASPSMGRCRQVVRGPLALLGQIDPDGLFLDERSSMMEKGLQTARFQP